MMTADEVKQLIKDFREIEIEYLGGAGGSTEGAPGEDGKVQNSDSNSSGGKGGEGGKIIYGSIE